MRKTNDEHGKLNNLFELLQPHVTGFSSQILKDGKHKDPVTCGGIVTHVLDMNVFSYTDQYEVVHRNDVVYATIDDAIGELLLIVPGIVWRNSKATLKQIIIAEGILYSLDKQGTFVNKAKGIIPFVRNDEPLRVLVATVTRISESG